MSVSAIFPSSALQPTNDVQNANQRRKTEFQQLTQALQSAELASAQQALGELTRSATTVGLQSSLAALQSGDPAGAGEAYTSVQKGLPNWHSMAAHHHRPQQEGSRPPILTSGFPGETGTSNTIAGSPSEVFQPVNLTA